MVRGIRPVAELSRGGARVCSDEARRQDRVLWRTGQLASVCGHEERTHRNDCSADYIVFSKRLDDWMGKNLITPPGQGASET